MADQLDLPIWQASYGKNLGGDANDNGVTDGADFLLWQREFTASGSQHATTNPEPTSASLLVLGAILAALNNRQAVKHRPFAH